MGSIIIEMSLGDTLSALLLNFNFTVALTSSFLDRGLHQLPIILPLRVTPGSKKVSHLEPLR